MRWFRLYDDVLNDPKVQKLDGDTFKFWINMLCIASKHGGVLPSLEDMAFELRVSMLVCTMKIDALKAAGLIDGDKRLKPHGWEKRQYKSDTSTERVKRFRERSSNVTETVTETVPDTDTEADTETEQIQIKKTNKKSRSKPLADSDFEKFWSSYPKKVGRGAAERAWKKAVQLATAEEITRIAKVYPWGDDKQFIPHPATWLNQQRWQDQLGDDTPKPKTKEEQDAFLQEHYRKMEELWANNEK
jgi:hypothetical protein